MDKSQSDKDGGRKFFSNRDFSLMCDWLQIEGHLECVRGSDGKTKVGARYPNKKQAFAAMAAFINANQVRGSVLVAIDSQGARNRFTNVNKKFKLAKIAQEGTGWGLTAEDEQLGIRTIEAKLEKLCPCFSRLDAIMEGQPEVDIAGNLYNAGSVPNQDGTMPADILSNARAAPLASSSADGLENASSGLVQFGPRHPPHRVEQVINLEADSNVGAAASEPRPPTPVRANSVPSSPSSSVGGDDSGNEDMNPHSTTISQPSPSFNKQKPTRFASGKKRPYERNSTLTGAFTSSMELLSEGKLHGIQLREMALEAKLAQAKHDRSIRAQNQQRQLDLDAFKMKHEEKRMEHSAFLEGKRLDHSHRSKERKMELQEKKAKVQARIMLMKVNRHRPPEEIERLLSLMENNVE